LGAKKIKKLLHKLFTLNDTPKKIALSFAIGVFISITPTFGFHTILAIIIAFLFQLNKISIIIGTLLNNPWTTVFVYALSYKIGALLLNTKLNVINNFSIDFLLHKGLHIYLITWFGSIIIAIPVSVFFYFIVKFVLEKRKKIKNEVNEIA
jgi:uncharacterized protein (DUF2062 family)